MSRLDHYRDTRSLFLSPGTASLSCGLSGVRCHRQETNDPERRIEGGRREKKKDREKREDALKGQSPLRPDDSKTLSTVSEP